MTTQCTPTVVHEGRYGLQVKACSHHGYWHLVAVLPGIVGGAPDVDGYEAVSVVDTHRDIPEGAEFLARSVYEWIEKTEDGLTWMKGYVK